MLNSLIDLFFPKICYACGNAIESKLNHICLRCRHQLPRANSEYLTHNSLEKVFLGRLDFEKSNALFRFQKEGKIQNLFHALKYRGVKEIGLSLGELAALELKDTGFFNEVDLLLPVPIHSKKMRKRGFNQSHFIAKGVEDVTSIKVNKTAVVKEVNTASQTKKRRFERWKNVNKTFKIVDSKALAGKHILIIDDVVTTGATVEALGIELQKIDGVKISLLTIATTF